MKGNFNIERAEKFAHRVRWHIVETVIRHGEGHAGPSLSCTDILATLYNGVMKYDPQNPKWEDRDRLLVSGGHKCLGLYGTLVEAGFFDESVLNEYNKLNSRVPAHPDMKKLPGIDFSTGSLGHGLPLACGMALAAKKNKKDYRVFVIMGDGEQGEGSVWESASYAAAKGLDNIVGILDRNGLQINGTNAEVCNTAPLEERYKAFGWDVVIVDGHDVGEIQNALQSAPVNKGKPTMVICNTIKSKGMPFAEGSVKYHHWHPGKEEANMAVQALRDYQKERWGE
ncbi:transketolase [Anaerobium acetethylicum]|uniref:Transketolase n=1 Tax=Anaerobium acetethylicum TaxID=1619234 RepID=A0A1D3TW27_9FIRM|nr:transketolase [Anaerobium acetethylicum]SCP98405.1 transketolase [Anaerobium acetethylicum]